MRVCCIVCLHFHDRYFFRLYKCICCVKLCVSACIAPYCLFAFSWSLFSFAFSFLWSCVHARVLYRLFAFSWSLFSFDCIIVCSRFFMRVPSGWWLKFGTRPLSFFLHEVKAAMGADGWYTRCCFVNWFLEFVSTNVVSIHEMIQVGKFNPHDVRVFVFLHVSMCTWIALGFHMH